MLVRPFTSCFCADTPTEKSSINAINIPVFFISQSSFFTLHYSLFTIHSSLFTLHSSLLQILLALIDIEST